MSSNNGRDEYSRIAETFGIQSDPAAEWAAKWEAELSDIDPFEVWLNKRKRGRISENTLKNYHIIIQRWKDWMAEQGRHPAFPSPEMVRDYGRWVDEEHPEWSVEYKKEHLRKIGQAYAYFQENENFPHTTDFDPWRSAKKDLAWYDEDGSVKPIHRLSEEEIAVQLRKHPNVRTRAIVLLGLKMGLRAGEVANIRLPEMQIDNEEVLDYYPSMGEHYVLAHHDRRNAVYIPPGREGNKSEMPKVIPIDDELRRVLIRYLLIRPDASHDYLFMGKTEQTPLEPRQVNAEWHEVFPEDEYGETERRRSVTSHYGRHFLNTYLRDEKEWDRDKIRYLRGDKRGHTGMEKAKAEALDRYIHIDYESIEERYLRDVPRFGL